MQIVLNEECVMDKPHGIFFDQLPLETEEKFTVLILRKDHAEHIEARHRKIFAYRFPVDDIHTGVPEGRGIPLLPWRVILPAPLHSATAMPLYMPIPGEGSGMAVSSQIAFCFRLVAAKRIHRPGWMSCQYMLLFPVFLF